ncbi:MAG: carbon storage regulator CsrA [Verrucomicrobia bacterium]|nr:carbon storage regulator CsrA [Verrucomicrobiota bacterium]
MLILSRKSNESVVIDGRILVKVIRLDGDVVKLGIEAPADVPVHRQEVYDEIQRSNHEALTTGKPIVPRLTRREHRSAPEAALVVPRDQNYTRTVTH